ncbi:hypothetical protein [Streptomyces violascens]|uniref:hypothetical protein n=1 Tax=Streptomyces violascens TaxID=67381 RepID=UPI00367A0B56
MNTSPPTPPDRDACRPVAYGTRFFSAWRNVSRSVGIGLLSAAAVCFFSLDMLRRGEQALFTPVVNAFTGNHGIVGWRGGVSALVPLLTGCGLVSVCRSQLVGRVLAALVVSLLADLTVDLAATLILVATPSWGGGYIVAGTLSGMVACMITLVLAAGIIGGQTASERRSVL